MDDVIFLVEQSLTTNDYGVERPTETKRMVYAKVLSVTRAEYFNGGRNGLNPQLRFDIFHGDYNEETIIEYQTKRYAVYRVYSPQGSDYIELYTERRGGTNGSPQANQAD